MVDIGHGIYSFWFDLISSRVLTHQHRNKSARECSVLVVGGGDGGAGGAGGGGGGGGWGVNRVFANFI